MGFLENAAKLVFQSFLPVFDVFAAEADAFADYGEFVVVAAVDVVAAAVATDAIVEESDDVSP